MKKMYEYVVELEISGGQAVSVTFVSEKALKSGEIRKKAIERLKKEATHASLIGSEREHLGEVL